MKLAEVNNLGDALQYLEQMADDFHKKGKSKDEIIGSLAGYTAKLVKICDTNARKKYQKHPELLDKGN